ncbi:MAG: hypothetical protein AB7S26_42665 [Sandaracinaceae bacterium]
MSSSRSRWIRVGVVVLLGLLGWALRALSERGSELAYVAVGFYLAAVLVAWGLTPWRQGDEPTTEDDERLREEVPSPAPFAVRVLAWGGVGLVLIGLGKLAFDALSEVRSEHAWLPLLAGTAALIAAAYARALAPEESTASSRPPHRAATIALFGILAIEALVPLRYYTSDDAFDERFSWRMFSAVRVYRCRLEAFDERAGARTPVNLMTEVQVGWINTLERNREAVQDRYLTWRCEDDENDGARLVNHCLSPEGRAVDVERSIDCASGEITSSEDHAEGAAP